MRSTLIVIAAFVFFVSGTCNASAAALEDPKAGYSLQLPDDWVPLPEATVQFLATNLFDDVAANEKGNAIASAKGMGVKKADNSGKFAIVAVVGYYAPAGMKITDADIEALTGKDTAALKRWSEMTSAPFRSTQGLTVTDVVLGDGAFTIFCSLEQSGAAPLTSAVHMAFTKKHVIVLQISYRDEPGNDQAALMRKLIQDFTVQR